MKKLTFDLLLEDYFFNKSLRPATVAYSGEDERWFRRNVNALFPNAP